MRTLLLASAMFAAGCATNQRCAPECVAPPCTSFERLACFDFRPNAAGGPNSLEDFRRFVQPGDLVVVYMEFQRAILRRQWIFTVLPVGHALVVLDPRAAKGLLETRFMGAQMIGPEELLQYSHCQIYRLRDRSLIDMNRLHEFAAYSCEHVKDYDPWSWIGWNGEMSPNDLSEISSTYSCSNFLAAAYYYSGVTLSVGRLTNKVVTPQSLAASIACPNRFSLGKTQPEASSHIAQ